MDVGTALESNAQLAKGTQPGMRALDDPAMTPEPIIALDAAPSNACRDAQPAQVGSATRKVVPLVRMQLARPAPGPAALTAHPRQGIDQLLEHHRVVPVGARDTEDQRDALAVRDDVALAAELASVRRVGACVRAPRGLATLAASRLARLKSSLPAPRNSASSNRCRRCQTPATCQSRRRRQHVMPLPKPSSWGNSSQGIPVRSTKTIPLSTISSLTRGRLPLSEGTIRGSSGSTFCHRAVLIALFLFRAMHRQTSTGSLPMTCFVSRSKLWLSAWLQQLKSSDQSNWLERFVKESLRPFC